MSVGLDFSEICAYVTFALSVFPEGPPLPRVEEYAGVVRETLEGEEKEDCERSAAEATSEGVRITEAHHPQRGMNG